MVGPLTMWRMRGWRTVIASTSARSATTLTNPDADQGRHHRVEQNCPLVDFQPALHRGWRWLRRLHSAPPERLDVAPLGGPLDGPNWPRSEQQREETADQGQGQTKPASESARPL